MKTFQVWMEGYSATGEHATASFLGTATGETFDEAVIKHFPHMLDEDPNQPDGYRRCGNHLCGWAIRFFDNEADARKSFG